MRQDRISDALLPSSGAPAPRLGHALLWKPSFVRDDTILWHVPFLFWLLETTKPRLYVEIGVGEGVGYLAVCQALHRMRAHSRCYAVGQWRDPDGSLKVPEPFATRNADLYEDFSQILTDGIEGSAQAIGDETVDLMMVDLMQDPAIVQSLKQIWLPKLSKHGVLILHGVGHDAHGASDLLESLSSKSPIIQMPGGDGLLVVLPGRGSDQEIASIAALTPDDPAHKLIVQMFTRLGAGAYHEVHSRQNSGRADALDEQIRQLTEERDSLAACLKERDRQYGARHRKSAILQSRVFDLQIASEAARCDAERLAVELSEAKAEEEKLNELLKWEYGAHREARERADKAVDEAESLKAAVADLTGRSDDLSAEVVAARVKQEEAAAEYYATVKSLLTALEENENLVSALTEELRAKRLHSDFNEAEQASPPGSEGLLNFLVGRKHG